MNVLVLGAGAREHALYFKLAASSAVSAVWAWPLNPVATSLGLPILDCPQDASWSEVARRAQVAGIDWVMVGPEKPLAEGFADAAREIGLAVFGPTAAAARLESSKAFAKEVMAAAGIPTASYEVFKDRAACQAAALKLLAKSGGAVLKASGLAAGKGVFVCTTKEEIEDGIARLYETMATAAKEVVVEELLVGRECSFFSFLGAGAPASVGFAVDYKRLFDGHEGPNTGGMGCYAPVPWLPAGAGAEIERLVVQPLLAELSRRQLSFTGCLYTGLMWTAAGPKVVEFNVRLGDPECQALVVQDERDWGSLIAAKLGLGGSDHEFLDPDYRGSKVAVGVVLATAGYPYNSDEAKPQTIEPAWLRQKYRSARIFAGGLRSEAGSLQTGSGRILTAVSAAGDFFSARQEVYAALSTLPVARAHTQYRRDIGADALTANP